MSRSEILQTLISQGAVAVIRLKDSNKLKKVAEAIYEGGVSAIEITMTTPDALKLIEEMSHSVGDFMQIGVGSVLDVETARMAINAGARFIVCPVLKVEIIQMAHHYDLPVIPGAFSPTEILIAHESGADIVKVFPAGVLGMEFFKAIKLPMPHLKLMPTGGVTLTNAGDWIKSGACAVGVGSALLDKKAIAEGKYALLTENAKILCQSIAAARK
ncbi:MAG: bifunctional 4-hydroxy-2-oxoglutarate aldolase/2-dehydro-3-deoxy-phosphogluconate aldolase [Fidelibacterota bacterium]